MALAWLWALDDNLSHMQMISKYSLQEKKFPVKKLIIGFLSPKRCENFLKKLRANFLFVKNVSELASGARLVYILYL